MFSPVVMGFLVECPTTLNCMPEGDSLHRAADRLQVLAGQRVEVETPHPRAAAKGLAERLNGRTLESVEAVGKNLLLRFEGGLVLRSHLRMTGRWRVEPKGAPRAGRPWLVLRGDEVEAVLWNGPVLELAKDGGRLAHLGPDILERPPDFDEMIERFRAEPRTRAVGDALLDQRLVAGIGNMWKAEALWDARVSPWRPLDDVSDLELRATLDAARAPDARGRRRRAAASARLPPRRARLPALRHRHPLVSAGRGGAHRLLVPGLPKRREGAEGVEGRLMRSPASLRHDAPLLPRRVRRVPQGSRLGSRSPVRVRGARDVRTADALRVPPARARLRRGARRTALRARRRAPGGRRLAARAGGADLRARPRHGQRRGARALPLGARAAPRAHRRRMRRLRLGRQRVRPFLRGARGVALRRRPLVRGGRAARRHLVRHADRARRRHSRPRGRAGRARGDVARGERASAARLRPRDRTASACSSSSARSRRARARRPTRRASSPTPSPRSGLRPLRPSPQGPCCSSGSTGGRTASARCCRSPRPRRPASRRDSIRSARRSRRSCVPQLALADDDAQLGDALDRWELSLFQDDPFRGEQLKHALDAALGDGQGLYAAGMRAAALLGETAEERADLVERFHAPTPDLVRRLLLAVLLHGNRAALLQRARRRAARAARRSRSRCTAARKLTHLRR